MPVDSYSLGAAMILLTNLALAFLKPFLADIPALKNNETQFNAALRALNVLINFGLIVGYVAFVGQLNAQDLPNYGLQAALQAAGANTMFLFIKGKSGSPVPTNTPLAQGIETLAEALGQPAAKQPLQKDPAASTSVVSKLDAIDQPTVPVAAVTADWIN